jgi:hypothetical protein
MTARGLTFRFGGLRGSCAHCGRDRERHYGAERYCDAPPFVACVSCGGRVPHPRLVYARPTCYACLPPPEPLPVARLARMDDDAPRPAREPADVYEGDPTLGDEIEAMIFAFAADDDRRAIVRGLARRARQLAHAYAELHAEVPQ